MQPELFFFTIPDNFRLEGKILWGNYLLHDIWTTLSNHPSLALAIQWPFLGYCHPYHHRTMLHCSVPYHLRDRLGMVRAMIQSKIPDIFEIQRQETSQFRKRPKCNKTMCLEKLASFVGMSHYIRCNWCRRLSGKLSDKVMRLITIETVFKVMYV